MNITDRIKLMTLALLVSYSLSTVFATMPQAKIEAEKIAYLKAVINPGKTHAFLVKNSAMVAGLVGRMLLHCFSSDYITRNYIKDFAHKIYSTNKLIPSSDQEDKKTKNLVIQLQIFQLLLTILAESHCAEWTQSKLLKNEAQDRMIPGLGGICGTLLYSAYHKLFFSNKRCLQRTLDAFSKSPEKFPTAAHVILQEAENTITTMDAKTVASVCKALHALTEPA